MKTLSITIFIMTISFIARTQSNDDKILKLEKELKRFENEQQVLENRSIEIQDSINTIKSLIQQERLINVTSKGFICITQNNIQSILRTEPLITGKEIIKIPKNNNIKVLEYAGENYWKVSYNKQVGFINEVSLAQTQEMKDVVKAFNENKKNQELNQLKENNARNLKQLEERFGKENYYRISNHMIWIGMTKEMARASIGGPSSINTTTGSWGVHEQWVYNNKYLYFENGILTSWQDEK
ncbi:MAG TPA: hypothetical protein PLH74_04885 [Tenuifilaceae bacterium]|mgnify:CR=1 FL=1|nr:hypothetical protein [Tenuifilaceae bacterium]